MNAVEENGGHCTEEERLGCFDSLTCNAALPAAESEVPYIHILPRPSAASLRHMSSGRRPEDQTQKRIRLPRKKNMTAAVR